MQRSSDAIGTIAAALAKAQAQLVNPEKFLTGSIRVDGSGGAERSFRYAPLSSGLDIVRKTLSQHGIATVQTTSIDESAGIVRLSTVLAHASGEWIASDWPVCPITETERPHRMGAALTYARRYSLFTLVGIAGEDDLDAPDLLNSTQLGSRRGAGAIKPLVDNSEGLVLAAVCLDAAASAQLRDLMLSELNAIGSEDEAARWAHRRLPEKNKLNDRDAEHIEETFRARLSSFAIDYVEEMAELTGNAQAFRCHECAAEKSKSHDFVH